MVIEIFSAFLLAVLKIKELNLANLRFSKVLYFLYVNNRGKVGKKDEKPMHFNFQIIPEIKNEKTQKINTIRLQIMSSLNISRIFMCTLH